MNPISETVTVVTKEIRVIEKREKWTTPTSKGQKPKKTISKIKRFEKSCIRTTTPINTKDKSTTTSRFTTDKGTNTFNDTAETATQTTTDTTDGCTCIHEKDKNVHQDDTSNNSDSSSETDDNTKRCVPFEIKVKVSPEDTHATIGNEGLHPREHTLTEPSHIAESTKVEQIQTDGEKKTAEQVIENVEEIKIRNAVVASPLQTENEFSSEELDGSLEKSDHHSYENKSLLLGYEMNELPKPLPDLCEGLADVYEKDVFVYDNSKTSKILEGLKYADCGRIVSCSNFGKDGDITENMKKLEIREQDDIHNLPFVVLGKDGETTQNIKKLKALTCLDDVRTRDLLLHPLGHDIDFTLSNKKQETLSNTDDNRNYISTVLRKDDETSQDVKKLKRRTEANTYDTQSAVAPSNTNIRQKGIYREGFFNSDTGMMTFRTEPLEIVTECNAENGRIVPYEGGRVEITKHKKRKRIHTSSFMVTDLDFKNAAPLPAGELLLTTLHPDDCRQPVSYQGKKVQTINLIKETNRVMMDIQLKLHGLNPTNCGF